MKIKRFSVLNISYIKNLRKHYNIKVIYMFTFFMVALDHTHTAQLVKFLLKYINDDAEYIVGLETCETAHKETNGQHFHFAVEMEEKQYDNFRKSILVNHYKLRGRATKNLPRQ
uniref:hypothetical protein n=1 Tax=Flavobacterium sp. TaxID=239 RepID=UPI00404798F9